MNSGVTKNTAGQNLLQRDLRTSIVENKLMQAHVPDMILEARPFHLHLFSSYPKKCSSRSQDTFFLPCIYLATFQNIAIQHN